MMEALRKAGKVTSPKVYEAMRATDRGFYAPQDARKAAYADSPQPIGHNATISAPHMHAIQLEYLASNVPESGARVLDVGSGSGYIAACFARMVGETGRVVGIEHISALTSMSIQNVQRDDPSLLESERLKLVTGDGRQGLPTDGPYHAIHVGAAAPELPPALVEQLAPGGRMVCPVGPKGEIQRLVLVDRAANGKVSMHDAGGVVFVPLTDVGKQEAPGNSTKIGAKVAFSMSRQRGLP